MGYLRMDRSTSGQPRRESRGRGHAFRPFLIVMAAGGAMLFGASAASAESADITDAPVVADTAESVVVKVDVGHLRLSSFFVDLDLNTTTGTRIG